jgi:hypothetical protein
MAAPMTNGQGDALNRELVISRSKTSSAAPEVLWGVLADLRGHFDWGSRQDPKIGGLLSLEAPSAPAAVGTEITSTGEDRMCRMQDRSVVTEVTPPRVLEFVTESSEQLKKSGARTEMTLVHRYEVEPEGTGSRVTHTYRVTRASALPGPFRMLRIPILRSFVVAEGRREIDHGLQRLVDTAERRVRAA